MQCGFAAYSSAPSIPCQSFGSFIKHSGVAALYEILSFSGFHAAFYKIPKEFYLLYFF
jgi:hypothetical protein